MRNPFKRDGQRDQQADVQVSTSFQLLEHQLRRCSNWYSAGSLQKAPVVAFKHGFAHSRARRWRAARELETIERRRNINKKGVFSSGARARA